MNILKYIKSIEASNNTAKEKQADYLINMSLFFAKAYMFGIPLLLIYKLDKLTYVVLIFAFIIFCFGYILSLVFKNRALELLNEVNKD